MDADLAMTIREAALACGFEDCGIIRVGEMKGHAEALAERVRVFPESEPMYSRLSQLSDPKKIVPWAKSIVICINWYGKYRIPKHLDGIISKVFCVDPRLDPASTEYKNRESFKKALDDLGIRYEVESKFGITSLRWAAAKAGLGVIRNNNFFYTAKGSWCMMEAFLIENELELKANTSVPPCPSGCSRCTQSCPTGALREPFQTNGVECATFLLNFGSCGPDKPLYDKCGGWIYGCESCQDACPFNKGAWTEDEEYPGLKELAERLSYEKILAMDYKEMETILPRKFWYIQPEDTWKWKCNIINAMRNTYKKEYRPHIEAALRDAKEEVRTMAQWTLKQV